MIEKSTRRHLPEEAAVSFASSQSPSSKCNVLLLMTDEHSPHALGCYGNTIVKTPALDALAKEGFAFHSAYCQNPICVPSRASLLTGRMPSNVGVFSNGGGLDPDVATLADVFKEAGYAAAWMGKEHWGGDARFDGTGEDKMTAELDRRRGHDTKKCDRLPENAAFTDWPATAEIETITAELGMDFLEQHRDKPFFLGISFPKPHFPFLIEKRYVEPYLDTAGLPDVTREMLDQLPISSRKEREKYGFANLTDEQIRFARAVYFGMVTFVDELFGKVLDKLDALGLRENTIVLYASDHGEMAGERGLWYKNSFYEASAGVPFIWSCPWAIPRGKTSDAPAMLMDIFPTLCDLCSLPRPGGLEGDSLLPLMQGKTDGKDRVALSENYRGGATARMIRTQRWKYCYFHDDREHLYDMREDPDELINQIDNPEFAEVVASLKKRALDGWSPEDHFLRAQKAKGKKAKARSWWKWKR